MNVKDGGFISLLTQVHKALNRRTGEELLGMRFKPYMTLGFIRDHPGITQQEIESALFMDANSVVLILNELEAAQFSVRRRDPSDRRRHIVEITAAGKRTRCSRTSRPRSAPRSGGFWIGSSADFPRRRPRETDSRRPAGRGDV